MRAAVRDRIETAIRLGGLAFSDDYHSGGDGDSVAATFEVKSGCFGVVSVA